MKKIFTKSTVLTGFPMALLCCLLIFGWTNATALPGGPPSNDECASAIVLTPGATCSTISGNNFAASGSAQADACAGTYNDDVWFTFIAVAAEATITIDGSSDFDAVFEVLEGSTCGTQTSLACIDVTGEDGIETTTLTSLVAGQVYFVRVAHYWFAASTTNTFDICVESIPPCDNSQNINIGQYPGTATTVDGGGAVTTIASDALSGNEFSVATGIEAFHSYDITHSNGASTYITVRSGATDGPVVGSGTAPLTVTANSTDDLYIHWTLDATCTASIPANADAIWTTTVQDLNPGLCSSSSINYNYCPVANDATEWLFVGANPGEMPSVLFNAGSMENCCDFVTVYDGTSTSDPVLYVSTSTGGDLTGTLVTSTSGDLLIIVETDGSGQCSSSSSYDALDFDVLCGTEVIEGCTDPAAVNYNVLANVDDASCILPTCADPAVNYTYCPVANDATEWAFVGNTPGDLPTIVFNAGTFEACCDDITIYDGLSSSDPVLFNGTDVTGIALSSTSGNLLIVVSTDGSGQCSSSSSYDALDFDVFCGTQVFLGCTNPAAINYNALATVDDASCLVPACTTAVNQVICYDNDDNNGVDYLYVPAAPGDLPSLYINAGSVEVTYDDVTIYDGTSTADPVLFTADGDVSGTYVVSTSGFLLVVISSDGSGSCTSSSAGTYTPLDFDVYCGLPCEASDAGTITADASPVCIDGGTATISGTPVDQVQPAGYAQIYVLTDGTTGVILDAGPVPSFDITTAGDYVIHTAVYNPAQFDPASLAPGTTGQDVYDMTIEGGGILCASLDLTGTGLIIVDPEPVADFTSAQTAGTLDVAFTDASSDATSWGWDFGDGNTSTQQNPTHAYAADGTYTVCLIAINDCDTDGDTLCSSFTVAPLPPANDLCINAEAIACGASVTASVDNSTVAGGLDCHPNFNGVWYTFVGDGSTVAISTDNAGTDYDTYLSVAESCGGPSIYCDDDGSDGVFNGFNSLISFSTVIGQAYYINVTGWGVTQTGTFELSITCTPPAPVPANDLCANATPISCGDVTAGTNLGATEQDVTPSVGSSVGTGVWYTFAGTGGDVTLSTCDDADFDSEINVITTADCIDYTNNVAGNDDGSGCSDNTSEVTFTTTAGETYYVYVSDYASGGTEQGTFNLTLTCDPTVGISEALDGGLNVYPNPSNGQFVVEVSGVDADAQITVMDVAGRQIYTESVNMNGNFRKELNLNIASGTYLLQISTVEGKVTRKIQVN
jgi:PKD repeat protein